MPSDSNSPSSNYSSDEGNPNSDPNSEPQPQLEPEPESEVEAEPNKNPHLIDQSLDALENQLASISMSSRSPTATIEGEEEEELEEDVGSREQPKSINGSLSEEIGAGGDADYVEGRHFESDSKAESSGVNGEKNTSFMWLDAPEVGDAERPLSPGSSGYAGEMGSTSGGDEIVDDDEDDSNIRVVENNEVSGSNNQSVSGKRHADEDDASVSWRKRKKHFIMLSHSGKPIYSRYGDEYKLAGFSATLQAIISFVENGGDRVNLVRAGKHQVVFLVKGPIYLVCISCTEEPYESLKGQLELLYGQMILILTKSVNRCFEKNPKFDMTSLLGGTDAVFSSLIHSLSWYFFKLYSLCNLESHKASPSYLGISDFVISMCTLLFTSPSESEVLARNNICRYLTRTTDI